MKVYVVLCHVERECNCEKVFATKEQAEVYIKLQNEVEKRHCLPHELYFEEKEIETTIPLLEELGKKLRDVIGAEIVDLASGNFFEGLSNDEISEWVRKSLERVAKENDF